MALLAQALVLTAEADQFFALGCRRTVAALAGIAISLADPVRDGLRGRFELSRQLFRRSPRSDQLDHLPPELRRIGSSKTRHRTLQKMTSKVSTKPGQLQTVCKTSSQLNSAVAG